MVPILHRHYYLPIYELDPRNKTSKTTPLALRLLPPQPLLFPLLPLPRHLDRSHIISYAINYILVREKIVFLTHFSLPKL